jgi:hypothetical protein
MVISPVGMISLISFNGDFTDGDDFTDFFLMVISPVGMISLITLTVFLLHNSGCQN